MILKALTKYYEALAAKGEIARVGWANEKVSFALNIDLKGVLINLMPLQNEELSEKKTGMMFKVMKVPERVVRSSGIKANFLCDGADYLLGLDIKDNAARALQCFEDARTLHLRLLSDADSPATQAVKAFFLNWQPEKCQTHPALLPYLNDLKTANLVFMIDGGIYAHEDAHTTAAWKAYKESSSGTGEGLCLVTGRHAGFEKVHGKVKGVRGAQSAGASLISLNADAFKSYRQEMSSVSQYAAFAYITALNHLLADSAHRRTIGDMTVVYWVEGGGRDEPDAFSWVMDCEPDASDLVRDMLDKLSRGQMFQQVDPGKRFYVLGLSPNAARVAVRLFLTDTFGAMLKHLHAHYDRLEIIRPPYAPPYLSLNRLLYETVNPKSTDKTPSPQLAGTVMRSILTGARYPQSLNNAVMLRVRAECGELTPGRAAIIKACLLHSDTTEKREEITVALNENTTNRAYVLGRLFAVLERTQKEALPGLNTTIKDRYFNSACATPGSIFPTLLKLSSFHISKAMYSYKRSEDIQELMDKLDVEQNPFPARQTLYEQNLFYLGYYQQMQDAYPVKKKEDK